jgi:ADP-heptose:LPS heptosyltransferase
LIMAANDDILDLLKEKRAQAARTARRGAILQPGAIGDCILTLPLAEFMKNRLELGGIDILGHTEYIGILPGRTCVDGIRSIDTMDLNRLFAETKAFDPVDGDPLINVFANYVCIATFMGEPNSNFEQNLIFTANCSHSSEVITLSMKPAKEFSEHLADFYIQQFTTQSGVSVQPWRVRQGDCLIRAGKADVNRGRELLEEIDVDFSGKLVVIQPGSGGEHKCWHLDNFLALAEELCSRGFEVIFLLGPAELDRFSNAKIKKINSVAKCLTDLSLTQVLGLLSCADGFVGNDSGITHLAAGLGVKTLAVFGPTNPDVYGPVGPDVTVFADSTTAFAKEPSTDLQQELLEVLME